MTSTANSHTRNDHLPQFTIYGTPAGSRNAPVVRALTHRLAAAQYARGQPLTEITRGSDRRARRYMVGGSYEDGGHRIAVLA